MATVEPAAGSSNPVTVASHLSTREPLRKVAAAAGIILLCLALFLPGFFTLPPTDRDEARFAQATRQMLESGDFVDIRFQGEARHKKPIGIYWLQSVAVTLGGGSEQAAIWVYRLPSLIGAILAVILTAWIGTSLFGPAAGLLAAVMLAGTVLLGVEARIAKTDAALLASILGAQAVLARVWLARAALPLRLFLLFWGALGVGILLKGPIILLVTGGTILWLSVAERGIGWLEPLRPKLGLPVLLAIVAPWLILITIKTHGAFFYESVGHDMLTKVAGGQEAKGFPPGYYTMLFPVTFWPWSLLALPGVPWVWLHRRDPTVMFCLAWIIPTWLVFEAVPTKLLHYVLPAYAALAILVAAATLNGFGRPRPRLVLASSVIAGLVGLVLTGSMAALPIALEGRVDIAAVLLALVTLVLGGAGLHQAAQGRLWRCIIVVTACAATLYLLAFQVVFPGITTIWLSPRIAEAVATGRPCPNSVLASAGFSEPSLVFLTGTTTLLTSDGGLAARHLGADACGLALIDQYQSAAFHAEMARIGLQPMLLQTIRGINYSSGKELVLSLYRR